MKVRYKDKFEQYILSIGMIVKNEEKFLPACLEALKPLMEAVPSELIVVDTGSEDRTVEIAKEYTDKVLFYEWNNDFAAARNFGLDRALGQWFMYLDADEQLVNPEELITFFNSKDKRDKYFSAEINICSFLDKEKKQTSNFSASRIFRMNMGNRFFGAIHEVPMRITPAKIFTKSYFEHYGYLYETEEDKKRKFKRNNDLLEIELEKSPDDIRLLCLYATSCPDEKRREVLEHGRELVKGQPDHYYFPEVYWRLTRELCRLGKFEEIPKVAEEYKSLTKEDHVGELEIAYNLTIANYQINQWDETIIAGERYLELYDKYMEGTLIKQDKASTVCERASYTVYTNIFPPIATALLGLGRFKDAFEMVLNTDLREISKENDTPLLLTTLKAVCGAGRLDWFVKADQWVKGFQLPPEQERPYITNFVNVYLQKADIFSYDAGETEIHTTFSDLIHCGMVNKDKEWDMLISQMAKDKKNLEDYGVVALYLSLKNQRDLLPLLKTVSVEMIQKWNIRLVTQAKKLGKLLAEYELDETFENNMLIRFWLADFETRLVNHCEDDYKLVLAHRIMKDMSWYVSHLYNEHLLTPEGICILSSVQQFAYWAGKALEAKSQENTKEYVRLLGEALRGCPEMADIVDCLLQEVQDNDEALKVKREQQELAQKIKGIVEGMILAGNKEDAQSILAQYELIAPNDPDIPALKAAILQQPSLSEI